MLRAEPVPSEAFDSNETIHRSLARANAGRFTPRRSAGDFDAALDHEAAMRRTERAFVEAERGAVKGAARRAPSEPAAFSAWFESLAAAQDAASEGLFVALERSNAEQLRWFLAQERARSAAFAEWLTLTQLNMPARPQLELAQDSWQTIHSAGSAPPFTPVPKIREQAPPPAPWEALAVSNLMSALASARHYAYQSLGALGFAERVAPRRAARVNALCARLNVNPGGATSIAVDERRLELWNREVLLPLIIDDPSLAPLIAEGILLRLRTGARADARCVEELARGPRLVARFEYADESAPLPEEPAVVEPVFPAPRGPAVRPVRWREVSARPMGPANAAGAKELAEPPAAPCDAAR